MSMTDVDMTHDMAPFPAARNNSMQMSISNYVPKRSIFDPMNTNNMMQNPQPQLQPMQKYQFPPPPPPMANPSPLLAQSLEKQPLAPSGLLVNDRPVPEQLVFWQNRGGFWGRVSNYYINKHNGMSSVYKSPFQQVDKAESAWDGKEPNLAERYYTELSHEEKARIDEVRGGMGRRP